jgi:hypothetical protein
MRVREVSMADLLDDSVRLYGSIWKSLLLFLAALLFVVIGLVLIAGWGIVGWIVGGVSVAFFGVAGVYWLTEAVWRRPSVRMDRGGMSVRAHLGAAGYLPWSEVTGATLYRVRRQRMLGIEVRDRQALIARTTPLRRFFMRANQGLGYPLVNIPQTAVADDLADVAEAMRRFKPDLKYTVEG